MKKIGIVAEKLSHSLSPEIHNYWIKKNKIKADFFCFEIEKNNLKKFYNEFERENNFLGFNITVPYKEVFYKLCPNVSTVAKAIGAINLVYKKNNIVYGDNTDYLGFKKTYKKIVKGSIKNCLVIGAGGASKAVLAYLNDQKIFDIDIYSRSILKKKTLARKVKFRKFYVDPELIKNKQYDLIINASTSGMMKKNYLDKSLYGLVRRSKFVIDIVYNPTRTKLIQEADAANIPAIGGLTMLLEQAKPSFQSWFKTSHVETEGYIYNKIKNMING